MGNCTGKCVSSVNTLSELLKKLENIDKALESVGIDCPRCKSKPV